MPAVAEADAGDLAGSSLDAGHLHAEVDAHTGVGMAQLEEFGNLSCHRARHHTRGKLDHVDLEPLGARGRGEFKPDEAGADHHDALAGGDAGAQGLAFVEGTQVAHILEVGIGQVEQAVARAGGEHEMAIVERGARGELQLARGAVDRRPAIDDQFDVLVVIESFRAEHQGFRTTGPLQIPLRQRRPLVRQRGIARQDRQVARFQTQLRQLLRHVPCNHAATEDHELGLLDLGLTHGLSLRRPAYLAGFRNVPSLSSRNAS